MKPAAMHHTLRQAGMSLISVLVAIVIFGLGMLSIASLYGLAVPAQTANEEAIDTAAIGNQFWSTLQASPQFIAQIGANTTATYSPSNYLSAAPTVLQPMLGSIFSSGQPMFLPGASVQITTKAGADGNPCDVSNPAAPTCGVQMTIQWASGKGGGELRTQTFNYQVGF
ncbi:MAG: pilus assembly protein PilV [Thiomonas sp. 14-64-326]|uniref:Tfp pilus assembly protein PilV n=2 Tax=Thiomonas TaxID=32012 RepID=D5X5Y9_THIK1|nr:MAG: pilus assembly protein PilV [Thiomonas sp. 14-64-326]